MLTLPFLVSQKCNFIHLALQLHANDSTTMKPLVQIPLFPLSPLICRRFTAPAHRTRLFSVPIVKLIVHICKRPVRSNGVQLYVFMSAAPTRLCSVPVLGSASVDNASVDVVTADPTASVMTTPAPPTRDARVGVSRWNMLYFTRFHPAVVDIHDPPLCIGV